MSKSQSTPIAKKIKDSSPSSSQAKDSSNFYEKKGLGQLPDTFQNLEEEKKEEEDGVENGART